MSGFTVDPDALDAQATAVTNVGTDVGTGAAAEVAGAGQADFGVLIGATLGFGIRAVAQHAEDALTATSQALEATGRQLRSTAQGYRSAESDSAAGLTCKGQPR